MRAGRRLIDRSAGGSSFDGARKDLYARSATMAISKMDLEEINSATSSLREKYEKLKSGR
jgi:hypothetical protein